MSLLRPSILLFWLSTVAVASPESPRDDAIASLQNLLTLPEMSTETRAELRLRLASLYEDQARAVFLASEGADPGAEWIEKAGRLYSLILRDTPGWARADEASYGLAANLRTLGRADEADAELRRLVKGYPQSERLPDAYLLIGELAFDKGELGQAVAAYTRAAAFPGFDKHDYAQYKLGWCQYNAGEIGEAVATLRKIARGPLADEVQKDLARFFADGDLLDEAWSFYAGIGRLELVEGVGDRLAAIGRQERAVVAWKQLLASRVDGPRALVLEEKIVGGLVAAGRDAEVLAELRRIVDRYGLGSSWRAANPGAEDRIQPLLRAQAVRWQTSMKRLPTAPLADAAWQLFLAQYPADVDARYARAELLYGTKRYEAAYEQYMAVVAADPAGTHARFCAESAVFAAQKAGAGDRLVVAVDQFERLYPADEKLRGMLYQAAYDLYSRDQLDAANARFLRVIALDPTSRDSEQAANLVLDSYTLRKDWEGLAQTAAALIAEPHLGSADFRRELLGVQQNAALKQIEVSTDSPGVRADAYVAFVTRWPDAANADLALKNAGALYQTAGRLRDAIPARRQLLERFPRSRFAADTMVALAFDLESVADFAGAAELYERYASVATDARAIDALRSAAIFRDATGDWARSVADYRLLLQRAPGERGVRLEIGRILASHGDNGGARQVWLAVAKDPGASVDEVMYAKVRAIVDEDDAREAVAWFVAHRGGATGLGTQAAGEAALVIAAAEEARFVALRLDGPASTMPPAVVNTLLARQLAAKTEALRRVEQAYEQVIGTGSGAGGVAALAGIGRVQEAMADAIEGSYVPTWLTPDQQALYREELRNLAWPVREKAIAAYSAAAAKGHELGVLGDGAAESVRRLAALQPATRSAPAEVLPEVAFVSAGDVSAPFERVP